ncbi:hypothetical protein [Azospirillum doebereinerae]|uniref:Uncharacterized protein n=1 Tax=Azospirillum doebereinerae TaxID=92933 RepID=A0A3S0V3T4_9PROT|nr:hypothetical protein [Azospirillum doebereinerae]RUQ75793.1 hypothetical protein EJ913_01385 [Azospirillum doebereinerae]
MDRRRDRNIGTPLPKSPAWKKPSALAALALASVGLAGCGGWMGPTNPAEASLACPKVSIVRDLSEVTAFRAGGRDLTDLESRAALVDFAGNCDYASDGVTVNVNVYLMAERGPALRGDTAKYTYFVALAKPDDSVVSKAFFDTDVTFPAGQPRAGSREELAPKIPLPKDVNAKDWKVYLGFQLTPEQLAFNRSQMIKR